MIVHALLLALSAAASPPVVPQVSQVGTTPVVGRRRSPDEPLARPAAWTRIGMGGSGHLCRVALDPTDARRFFLGSDASGVFRTEDGGQSWSASSNGLPGLYVRSLLVHPRGRAT